MIFPRWTTNTPPCVLPNWLEWMEAVPEETWTSLALALSVERYITNLARRTRVINPFT